LQTAQFLEEFLAAQFACAFGFGILAHNDWCRWVIYVTIAMTIATIGRRMKKSLMPVPCLAQVAGSDFFGHMLWLGVG
jgi:hypothetical protein